jgi:hypothetical protein
MLSARNGPVRGVLKIRFQNPTKGSKGLDRPEV